MDTNNQTTQPIDVELEDFFKKSETSSQKLIEDSAKLFQEIESIATDIGQSVDKIDRICNELDQTEKNTTNQIDRLILEEAKLWADSEDEI